MAQKEWKREEMKQNQGRTEQNQRKKVQKKTGYRVLEENGMLYLKYRTEIRSLSKETGEMKTLCQFDTGDENSTFWVYGGGLYFDRIQAESGSTQGTELYGL